MKQKMDGFHLNLAFLLVLLVQVITRIGGEEAQMKILTKPQTFQKPLGSNISLPCSVLNLDGSVVTWSKDGQVISADTFKVLQDSRISVSGDREGVELSLSNLKLSDGGKYICALNLKHSVLSVVHSLNIEVPPTIHQLQPGNGTVTVRSGSRVRLECRAEGQPRPHIYWSRRHNQPFPWGLGSNMTLSGEVLSMTNITRSYSGDYVCNADNGVGRWPVRQVVSLNVLYPPEVQVESSWLHCGEGESVTIICRVYANPVARVLWYKETMKLIEGERLHLEQIGDTYKLTINKVRLQDYGQYYCRASNLLDKEVSRPVVLTGAPSVPQLSGNMRSSQVYSYSLLWSVQSHYQILQHELVYWQSHSQDKATPPTHAQTRRVPGRMVEQEGGNNRYNMMGLQNNTNYKVIVRSQNKFGWSLYSKIFTFQTMDKVKLSLTLQEKPGPVLDSQGPLKSEPVVSHSGPRISLWVTNIISSLLVVAVLELL